MPPGADRPRNVTQANAPGNTSRSPCYKPRATSHEPRATREIDAHVPSPGNVKLIQKMLPELQSPFLYKSTVMPWSGPIDDQPTFDWIMPQCPNAFEGTAFQTQVPCPIHVSDCIEKISREHGREGLLEALEESTANSGLTMDITTDVDLVRTLVVGLDSERQTRSGLDKGIGLRRC
jgi:hypothetical protein